MGSHGKKTSKFARQDSSSSNNPSSQDSDDAYGGDYDTDCDEEKENAWLCNHYKRRCHVTYACCVKCWSDHRCHNNESDCNQKKTKSIHSKFVKRVKCGIEQEVCA